MATDLKPGYYWVSFKGGTPEIAELSAGTVNSTKLSWSFCGSTLEWSVTSPNIKVIKRINELE